ncbi:MAG: porin family protein [Prolixibacteraceae bacterium]
MKTTTKNSLLLLSALMLISTITFGQFNYGLRTGAAVTTFANKGDITDNSNVTMSYTAGAFLDIPVCKSFYLQPEINYLRKGRSDETFELNTTGQTDFMVHYLQVPLLFQYRDIHLLDNHQYVFYINGGPYAAFALNNKMRPADAVTLTGDNKTDWGATLGIGFQAPICKQNIRFDLRYDIGMAEIGNQPSDYRTKALSLTVGIQL